jgi:hypothetical protein
MTAEHAAQTAAGITAAAAQAAQKAATAMAARVAAAALFATTALFTTTALLAAAATAAAAQTEEGIRASGRAEHQGDRERRKGKTSVHRRGLLKQGREKQARRLRRRRG